MSWRALSLRPAAALAFILGIAALVAWPTLPGGALSLIRQPYLQQVTPSSAIVVWATNEPGRAEVRFARPGLAAATATGTSTFFAAATTGFAADYYQHVVRLTGLSPSTTYQYDILVDGLDLNPQMDTLTTPPQAGTGTATFIAFGDSGTGSAAQQQVAARLNAESFDFALHAGDMAYGNSGGTGGATYQTTHDWFFAMYANWLRRKPMFPSMGNHDSRAANSNGRPYLDLFVLPEQGGSGGFPDHAERYYSFDYGPVHVVVLDTEYAFQGTDLTRRDAQLAWLDADLASTAQPWKVAVFHRSPYSAGGEHGSDLQVRAAFGAVFDRHGVQLSISAHEHVYERTVPMRGSQPDPSGTVYIVTGGGGGPLYGSSTGTWTAYAASVHHYVKGTASDCSLRMDAIRPDGAVFDTVTLQRCGTTPTPEPTPTGPSLGEGDILLYAADATTLVGNWVKQADASAAGGRVLRNPDRGAAKRTAPLAAPADYAEITFEPQPNVPYRLWMRSRAEGDVFSNDSVFVQFTGANAYGIGTTSAADYNLEDCSGCGLSGWGWQDNGWGVGVLGPTITFTTAGPQTLRLQTREDGLSIDQILLSPSRFMRSTPGALKNDTTIYPKTAGAGTGSEPAPAPQPPPPPPPPPQTMWTAQDIGAVGVAGGTVDNGAVQVVRGAGLDIWGTADAFHFAWQRVTGDADIVARVRSVEYVHAWVKAGVMIRERLTADSPHAMMLVSPGKGLAFQRRVANAGLSAHTSGGGGVAPVWLKLSRRGGTITASASGDGANWQVIGSDSFSMAAEVFVGLAVSSHDNTRTAEASFDSVAISQATQPTPPTQPTQPSQVATWASRDIGAVGAVGSGASSAGTFTVRGGGADIWNTADAFHYMWQAATGDFDLTARVTAVEYVHAWVKAGVMIREQLTPESPHALMLVSPGKGLAFQRRVAAGGLSTSTTGGAGTAPAWVKLERRGSVISAFRSPDGVTWTLVGQDSFAMGANVHIGLVVSSHVYGQLATATFDNLTLTTR